MDADGKQLKPEMLVPRLGEALLTGGHISDAELNKALAYEQEHSTKEGGVLLGEALLELKLIDRPALDQAIPEQVLWLRSALEAANGELERSIQEPTLEPQHIVEGHGAALRLDSVEGRGTAASFPILAVGRVGSPAGRPRAS